MISEVLSNSIPPRCRGAGTRCGVQGQISGCLCRSSDCHAKRRIWALALHVKCQRKVATGTPGGGGLKFQVLEVALVCGAGCARARACVCVCVYVCVRVCARARVYV